MKVVDKNKGWFSPETPSKPKRQHMVEVGGADGDIESSKKQKNNAGEVNGDHSHRIIKKKIYRPKVATQLFKRINKSESESKSTPKPSTPNKKKVYVRKVPKYQRSLFGKDSDAFFPFVKNFKGYKYEQGEFENHLLGIEYNSLRWYQNAASFCQVESRRIRENFPKMCKRKRTRGERQCLEKLLPSLSHVKGKRSKSFTRKRKCWTVFKSEDNAKVSKKMRPIINKICSLKKNKGQLVVRENSRELVSYKQPSLGVDVLLEEETLRVWNLLSNEEGHEENDEIKRKYWEDIRNGFSSMVETFISRMHAIQGDRSFSPWKGSVMDSVVGAFLTQNVSDHLSSSAFMTLAAKFPTKINSGECSKDPIIPNKQGLVQKELLFPIPKFDKELGNDKGFFKVVDDVEPESPPCIIFDKKKSVNTKKSYNQVRKEKLLEKERLWDLLRKLNTTFYRPCDQMDSADWEAVRCAEPGEVAKAIESRGQHNIIAGRIQRLLNMLMESNGSVDLEWLRRIPPKEAKEYLLNIYGLGLKSVECIRLLTLQHRAFPVDVNVGRIVVRLGWVPIQPLPEPIQLHNLEEFPHPNKVQQYLWPRLCTLDQRTLYELHYQLITFGKVFCTKKTPNCSACPMRNECLYYKSALASTKLTLPQGNLTRAVSQEYEPIIEMPPSPEHENSKFGELEVNSDEEFFNDDITEDIEDIPTIKLKSHECFSKTHNYSCEKSEHIANISTTLVALDANAANIPLPKMKNVSRLKTERLVYVLTDDHPLLKERDPREPDDPSPYLLVVWAKGELESSPESTKDNLQEDCHSLTVPGTLLIPCRTAMRGRFPLNGTYFQVNEVFADYTSMIHPINVPTKWLWNLKKKIVYFGTGTSSIMRGLPLKQIHNCFWNGFVCVRAMDAKTRASRPISSILHRNTITKARKGNKNDLVNEK
ncbi:DNA glycosylase/AP lyase ROS1-like [Lotus japonicus]|uniref:DNA glycosylase/AP lyase ROS1-like n=1 Tax=Lotus japonicus TaxID=34305 RepID=UPI00258C5272|nr:DNA glycosylase/AP lyase ROS1-like [Lotus japonicus]